MDRHEAFAVDNLAPQSATQKSIFGFLIFKTSTSEVSIFKLRFFKISLSINPVFKFTIFKNKKDDFQNYDVQKFYQKKEANGSAHDWHEIMGRNA